MPGAAVTGAGGEPPPWAPGERAAEPDGPIDVVDDAEMRLWIAADLGVDPVVHEPDGAMLMPGTFPIHDLPDIGLHDDGDYTTVAGLVLAKLGHIPTAPGETVDIDGATAEITKVAGRAITRAAPKRNSRWSLSSKRVAMLGSQSS